jgi:hypothetical protein
MYMTRNLVMFGMAIMFLSGFRSSYIHNEFEPLEVKLDPSLGVLSSTPDNGWYDQTEYKQWGRITANTVRAAFLKIHLKSLL